MACTLTHSPLFSRSCLLLIKIILGWRVTGSVSFLFSIVVLNIFLHLYLWRAMDWQERPHGVLGLFRLIILRRLFAIAAALYFLRSLTMVFTSLPVATQTTDCRPEVSERESVSLSESFILFVEIDEFSCSIEKSNINFHRPRNVVVRSENMWGLFVQRSYVYSGAGNTFYQWMYVTEKCWWMQRRSRIARERERVKSRWNLRVKRWRLSTFLTLQRSWCSHCFEDSYINHGSWSVSSMPATFPGKRPTRWFESSIEGTSETRCHRGKWYWIWLLAVWGQLIQRWLRDNSPGRRNSISMPISEKIDAE